VDIANQKRPAFPLLSEGRDRITDERLTDLEHYSAQHGGDTMSGMVSWDIIKALAELREYRAGERAPDGFVLVREADLRKLVSWYADRRDDCGGCICEKPECPVWSRVHPEMIGLGDCRAALLERLNLAQEPAPEEDDTDAR